MMNVSGTNKENMAKTKNKNDSVDSCMQQEPWITMEDWECMQHSQYYYTFFVVELVWEIGYMGKHFVCMLDKDDNFIIDCDWGNCRAINKSKIAAVMPFNPYNEKTLCK